MKHETELALIVINLQWKDDFGNTENNLGRGIFEHHIVYDWHAPLQTLQE
jgi:hypothetical protein